MTNLTYKADSLHSMLNTSCVTGIIPKRLWKWHIIVYPYSLMGLCKTNI